MKKTNKNQSEDKNVDAERKKRTSKSDFSEFPPDKDKMVVVGIGASAGGLEALQLLIPSLQPDANMAYVIAQHLDPKHRSMVVSLLARHTSMEVLEIRNGQKVMANKIYITPPDRDVTISGGILHLSKPVSAVGPKPSIDFFFTSLAEDRGENAVGIILSGTGSDGALGIRAIKAADGITIVQDETTAKYNGMPHAAIEMGRVDLILPPEKIGKELVSIIKYPHVLPTAIRDEKAPDDYQKILQILLDRIGCNFSEYKPNTIKRRIERRIAVHKLDTLEEYVHYLKHSPTETGQLYQDILISFTEFFRDPEAFKALEEILVEVCEKKKEGRNLRIWVPGCANGEEVYSIAILLAQILGDRLNSYNIQIFGTDLDEDAIVRARKGVYPEATVVDVDKSILDRYFIKEDNTFQITKSIREMVVFARQNVTKDPPFSRLDLISCRNLLIYFNTNLQKRILSLFHYVLNPGGYLFLGKSESIGQFDDLFTPANKKWKIFKSRGSLRTPPIEIGERRPPKYKIDYGKVQSVEKQLSIKDAMNRTIAEAYGHNSVVIDDRLEIVYVNGDVTSYLSLASGEAGLNILNMAENELRLDLRALIHKSTRENTPVRSKEIKIAVNEEVCLITLDVRPIQGKTGACRLTLVSFEKEIPEKSIVQQSIPEEGMDPRVSELEQELTSLSERLQTTVEELETANEELQSMNEEMQSTNEELQSSNEELETSNEELQSTNEELTTVNEELQVKSNELAYVNSDLANIIKRIGFAMVIVDKDLRVTRFTSPANKIFALRVGDIGQVLTTVPCQVSLHNLRDKLIDVINQEKTIEHEIKAENIIYWMRIFPYYSEHNKPAGAILTFLNITESRQAEEKIHQQNKFLNNVIESLTHPFYVVDADDYSLIMANSATYKGPLPKDLKCYSLTHKLNRPCEDEEYLCPLKEVKRTKKPVKVEHVHYEKDGSQKIVEIHGSPIFDDKGNVVQMIEYTLDITERKQSEKALQESEELHRITLSSISDTVFITDERGVFTYICSKIDVIFGCSLEEIQAIGTISKLLGDNLFDPDELRACGEIKNIEKEITDRAGRKHSLLVNVKEVSIKGGTVLYTCRDITEHKQAEEVVKKLQSQLSQTEKMSAIGTMVSGVAHELINPMMSIINFIQYCLKNTSADDERYAIMQDAEQETNRCIGIVESLLTFSRMEKEGEGGFQEGSCAAIIEQVLALLSYRLEKERIQVIKHYAEGLPEISMRVNSIQQVFLNIIMNALDALTEIEKKEIHIDMHREEEFIKVTIADNGPGITADNLLKIFDPFFTTKPTGEGTGLGLSISQGIVEMHKGKINCKSTLGQGAKFEILLPVDEKIKEVCNE